MIWYISIKIYIAWYPNNKEVWVMVELIVVITHTSLFDLDWQMEVDSIMEGSVKNEIKQLSLNEIPQV